MKKLITISIFLFFKIIGNGQPPTPIGCNNWLNTTNNGINPAWVNVGNVAVTGDQLTIEANFYSTRLLNNNNIPAVDLVSKHSTTTNANYLLRPNQAEITTTNGFRAVVAPCTFILNKWYHVAMVYDGASLRFYRNGFLMGQTPVTGNCTQNTLQTIIGWSNGGTANSFGSFFNGYINEVRIWSVARTQTQLRQFMNIELPTPTTQVGLQAYYTFDNLLNKQGNTAFNGTLFGGAAINSTVPNCNFVVDSCGVIFCPTDTNRVFSKCPYTSIPLNVRTGTTYSWSPSTGLSSTTIQNPTTNVNTNTTYVVTITNTTTNCTYRDTVKVIVNPLPISNIRDTSLCLGDTIQLNAPTGYSTYSWTPATNINNTNIPNPSVWPSATTNYIVTITNSFGCSIKDTVLVTVNNCGCEDSCNWSKTGNTFVKPTNFIGSKNNADFKVRTNNLQRMVVTAAGKIGLNIATPTKTLDVNGEAVVRNLPAANPNDKVVLANATGELKSLAPGAITQYLSGNGTWQTLPTGGGGGTVTAADQGVTLLNNNTVVLGDECGKGGGAFKSNREININNQNLYFNASRAGKIYMGSESAKFEYCKELNTRLEISSAGLEVKNDYATPNPSPSGLRFTNLTAKDDQIENKYGGVLSLDEDGDVIWVKACCNGIQIGKETTSILERLDKLEAELKAIKNENIVLKNKLNQTEIVLENANSSLEQNIPNPFAETTTIGYTIAGSFSKAVIVFNNANGQALKTVQLNSAGKGQIKIAASLVARGIYTYSLIVDGKLIETKKMIKE